MRHLDKRRSAWRSACAAALLVLLLAPGAAAYDTPPTVPQKPVSTDPQIYVAPTWLRAYELKLEANARWPLIPEATRARIEADYAANAARFAELMQVAYALGPRIDAHAQAVARFQADDAALGADLADYEARCTQVATEEELRRCEAERQALLARQSELRADKERLDKDARRLTAENDAHNERSNAWSSGPVEGFNRFVIAALEAARAPLDETRRRALEAQRAALRADVQGIQESLRRLEHQRASAESDRADWEQRYEAARQQSEKRALEFAADKTVDLGIGLLKKKTTSVGEEISRTLDERMNVAGGDAPDKAERVKQLDERLKSLFGDRSALDGAVGGIEEVRLRLAQALAAGQAGTAGDRQEALEACYEALSALLAEPLVQKGLKLAGAYADFAAYAKLAVDSSLDIATEVTAIVRVRSLNEQADRYLADVKRIGEQLSAKVVQIQALSRLLDAPK